MNMACPMPGDYWKVFVKTKDDTISGLGFQRIWLYTPRNTNGLNIR